MDSIIGRLTRVSESKPVNDFKEINFPSFGYCVWKRDSNARNEFGLDIKVEKPLLRITTVTSMKHIGKFNDFAGKTLLLDIPVINPVTKRETVSTIEIKLSSIINLDIVEYPLQAHAIYIPLFERDKKTKDCTMKSIAPSIYKSYHDLMTASRYGSVRKDISAGY